MKRLLWLVPLLLSCTSAHLQRETSVKVMQAEVARRNIAWIDDTIPVVRFDIPWVYGMYRLQVESCVHATRAGWPRFYIAPLSTFGANYRAAYYPDPNAIVFGLGNESNPAIVRHELIHYLIAPDTTHHPKYFSTDPLVGLCAPFLTEG